MATVSIVFAKAMQGIIPALSAHVSAAEAITSSGTSQATTATAASTDVARITSSGGAIWVKVGATPTAAAGSDHLVPDGGALDLVNLQVGDKIAVIDA
jgi:hypothetical protein